MDDELVYEVVWTGADGSSWNLRRGRSQRGVRLARISGVRSSPVEQHWGKPAPTLPGATLDATTRLVGRPQLTVYVECFGDPDGWMRHSADFLRAFSHTDLGELAIVTRAGGHRWVPAVLGDPIEDTWEQPAALIGHQALSIDLATPDPLWRSFDHTSRFVFSTVAAWRAATVSNTADLDAWVRYDFDGPGQLTVAPDGRSTTFPAVAAGQRLSVVTHPRRRSVLIDGVEVWDRMPFDYDLDVQLRPGRIIPLGLDVAGAVGGVTALEVTVERRYSGGY